MKRLGYFVLCAYAALAVLGASRLGAQNTGTLVFDVKNYTSDADIPKNAQKEFQHSGVSWGMADNTVVISLVSENFIKAKIANLTRYGEQQTLDLKPGDYTVTYVGYEWNSNSKDPDKNLSKSAYFNEEVVRFTVAAGKKTTLEVTPVYVKAPHWVRLSRFNFYKPDLTGRVLVGGSPAGPAIPISKRSDKSIAWDDYKGPLKF